MNSNSLTIIVPVYNDEKNLNRCIDSIINQDHLEFHQFSLEILLIDDGSTDSSASICDAYAVKHSYIHAFHKHNEGTSKTRQFGIEHAKYDYIAFIDSDDYVEKDFLSNIFTDISSSDADILFLSFYEENRQGKYAKNSYIPYSYDSETVMRYVLEGKIYSCLWNVVIKRAFCSSKNLCFSDTVNYGEDSLFIIEFLLKNPSVHFIYKPVYYHTYNLASFTRLNIKQRYKERECFHSELQNVLIKYNRRDLFKYNFLPLKDKYELLHSLLFTKKEYQALKKAKVSLYFLFNNSLQKTILLILAETAFFKLADSFIRVKRFITR